MRWQCCRTAASPRALLTKPSGYGTSRPVPKLPRWKAIAAASVRWQYCRMAAWPRARRRNDPALEPQDWYAERYASGVWRVYALAALPDGRLVSGSDDKTIRLWDLKTVAEAARLRGHGGPVNALTVLPDGRVVSGSDDKTIRLWDLKTVAEAARLEGHGGPVNALTVLPDGRVVSGSTIRPSGSGTSRPSRRLPGSKDMAGL